MFYLHKFLHFNFDITFVHVPRVSACREVSWVISETVLLAICRWDGYFSNHDSECCNIRSHLEKVQAWAQLNASLCCESHINVTKIQAIFLCDHERVYDRSHAKVRYIYTYLSLSAFCLQFRPCRNDSISRRDRSSNQYSAHCRIFHAIQRELPCVTALLASLREGLKSFRCLWTNLVHFCLVTTFTGNWCIEIPGL